MRDNHQEAQDATAKPAHPVRPDAEERKRLDDLLDEGLRETFPASDAVAVVLQPPEPPVATRRRRASRRPKALDDTK